MDVAAEQHSLDRRWVVRHRLMGHLSWRDLPPRAQDELADEIANYIVEKRLGFSRSQCVKILTAILKDSVKIQE